MFIDEGALPEFTAPRGSPSRFIFPSSSAYKITKACLRVAGLSSFLCDDDWNNLFDAYRSGIDPGRKQKLR
jgi:hypothetical protein